MWIWLCGCSVLDIRVLEASVTSVFKAEPGCKHQPLMKSFSAIKFQVPASWFYTIILKCIENISLHWYITGGRNEKGRPFIVKALKHAKPPFRQIIPYVFVCFHYQPTPLKSPVVGVCHLLCTNLKTKYLFTAKSLFLSQKPGVHNT